MVNIRDGLISEQPLRVLTYNIHKGFSYGKRRFVLHQIRQSLITTEADLLFLQEMQGEHAGHEKTIVGWPDCSQFEFIADGVWPHYAYGKNAIYNAGHHGNAILSKYPFENWENINVSPFPWASRSLLHGVIRFPNRERVLHVICIHFGLLGVERHRQIKTLCDRIDSHVPHDEPLIIAGDFNDWTGRAERRFQDDLELNEVFIALNGHHAKTFPAWMPMLSMDRIYYRGMTAVSGNRLSEQPWRRLSDHTPLLASFNL
jgi:endonuclease/exonuclease/phosphatase family metal-dependent hydrolase